MVAYMSDASGRERYWHGSAGYNAENAIREAQRILADVAVPSAVGGHIDLCDLFDAIVYRPDAVAFDYAPANIDPDTRLDVVLADSLAAILPELDRLAEDALGEAYLGAATWTDAEDVFWALVDRNRATLAAMGAGGR